MALLKGGRSDLLVGESRFELERRGNLSIAKTGSDRCGGFIMRRLLLILGFTLFALGVQVASVSATHWCGGAYDSKLGTNFGSCPGPAH